LDHNQNGTIVVGFEQGVIIRIDPNLKKEILAAGPNGVRDIGEVPGGEGYVAVIGNEKLIRFYSFQ